MLSYVEVNLLLEEVTVESKSLIYMDFCKLMRWQLYGRQTL